MEKTLKERLLNIKKEQEIGYINFFNDGKVSNDTYGFAKNQVVSNNEESIKGICKVLYDAAQSYSHFCDYDYLNMDLKFGLVFKKEDVDENNAIKEGALPIENVVRFYTGSVKCYLNGEQTNFADYYSYGVGRQGYVDYNIMVSEIEREGLTFCGPKTYEEFVSKILSKEKFDINISVDLSLDKEDQVVKKLEC